MTPPGEDTPITTRMMGKSAEVYYGPDRRREDPAIAEIQRRVRILGWLVSSNTIFGILVTIWVILTVGRDDIIRAAETVSLLYDIVGPRAGTLAFGVLSSLTTLIVATNYKRYCEWMTPKNKPGDKSR